MRRNARAFSRNGLLLLLGMWLVPGPVAASSGSPEATGALDVQVRVLEIVQTQTGDQAIARLEVVVESLAAARGVRLEVLQKGEAPWAAGKDGKAPRLLWTRTDGGVEPQEGGSPRDLGAGQMVRALIEVPLPGRGVHEIIVRATGFGSEGLIRTSGITRAEFGALIPQPVDDGIVSEFPAMPSQGVPR